MHPIRINKNSRRLASSRPTASICSAVLAWRDPFSRTEIRAKVKLDGSVSTLKPLYMNLKAALTHIKYLPLEENKFSLSFYQRNRRKIISICLLVSRWHRTFVASSNLTRTLRKAFEYLERSMKSRRSSKKLQPRKTRRDLASSQRWLTLSF